MVKIKVRGKEFENASENAQGNVGPVPPGKVYADSVNIYDDEARIAFDYFKKAARKIIAEEDRINGLKAASDARLGILSKEKGKNVLLTVVFAIAAIAIFVLFLSQAGKSSGAALALIPLVFFFVFLVKAIKTGKNQATEIACGKKLLNDFAHIKRDYTISKLGIAYVPVATSVPFEDKSFLLDDTATTKELEFSLYQMNNQNEFLETLDEIKKAREELPIVESEDETESVHMGQLSSSIESVKFHDYLGTLDRNLRSASYLLGDLKRTSVSLPVIDPKSDFADFLSTYCTDEVEDNPILNVFAQRTYAEELHRFAELNQMRRRMADENAKLEKVLQQFIVNVSEYVQLTSRAKLTSVSKIVDFSNGLLLNTFKSSYNHYSCVLESDEIKRLQENNFDFKSGGGDYHPFTLSSASRVRFDPVSGNWVSDDGGRTSFPFGIHQIQEEIVVPLVQNLLAETRTERLKIYNDIMDQKRDYLNQWHRDTDDFYGRGRAESSDIINQMQTALAEFNTAISQYKAYEDTEKSMKDAGDGNLDGIKIKASGTGTAFSITYCEEQTKQIRQQQDEFNDYIARLNEDIDRRASEFSYTKYYDASLRDGHAKEVAMSLLTVEQLNERQRMLLGANAYIASNAKLPPEPVVDGSVYNTLGTNLNDIAASTIANLDDLSSTGSLDIEEEVVAHESVAQPINVEVEGDDMSLDVLRKNSTDVESEATDALPNGEESSTPSEVDVMPNAKAEEADGDNRAEGADGDNRAEGADGDSEVEGADSGNRAEGADGDSEVEGADGDNKVEGADGDNKAEVNSQRDTVDDQGMVISENDIVFDCPHCGHSLVIDSKGAGRIVTCTECGLPVQVPYVQTDTEKRDDSEVDPNEP